MITATRKIHPTTNDDVRALQANILGVYQDLFRARSNGLDAREALTPHQWGRLEANANAAAIAAFRGFVRVWREYRKAARKRAIRRANIS